MGERKLAGTLIGWLHHTKGQPGKSETPFPIAVSLPVLESRVDEGQEIGVWAKRPRTGSRFQLPSWSPFLLQLLLSPLLM